ncbi:vacuolar transporter chaperone [Chytridiales sp. JEL 0842]|nr:vacuolar transporter chaperone [Chytridiales sp. JEL 0842]
MKFGKRLESEVFNDWKFYALDYKRLKTRIKQSVPFTEEDETAFVTALEKELDKVHTFCTLKLTELKRRITLAQQTATSISLAPHPSLIDTLEDTIEDASIEGSEEDSEEARRRKTQGRLEGLDREIRSVTAEVKELAGFAALNFTGIKKIVKKHDKQTQIKLTTYFNTRLNSKSFFQETYDDMIYKLSEIWDLVRHLHGGASSKDKSPGVDAQNIVRKTTKYWVHPDNVVEVKLLVLKHLPVLVFKKGVQNDPALNSIYFDNPETLPLYHSRMVKDEGSQNLRFRWYGHRSNATEVWVERKTHHEDWTGEKSIKERFPIKEKYLNAYLRGEYKISHTVEKLRAEGKKKAKDLEDMQRLGDEVQEMVLKQGLKPLIRTAYNRTAFQLPADARVRISLDTELCLIREDGPSRSDSNWRRNDESGWPFKSIPDSDIIRFPYAVLEIKLQTQFGQEAPRWATELAKSHLVEAVPKFSKFHHAVSNFFTPSVQMVPYWFYQMDKSILKPKPPLALTKNLEEDDLDHEEETGKEESKKREGVKVDQFGKVYFSNERTFLRWLNYSVQILSFSLLLINLTTSTPAQIIGLFFTVMSLATLVWSLVIFHIRCIGLRVMDPKGPWDYPWLPRGAVGMMVGGVVVGLLAAILGPGLLMWK